jgi:hypothetical protein
VKLYSKPKSSQFFWILIWWKEAGERKSKEELKNNMLAIAARVKHIFY